MIRATTSVQHEAQGLRFGLNTGSALDLKLLGRFRKRGLTCRSAGANGLLHNSWPNATQGLDNAGNCLDNCLQI